VFVLLIEQPREPAANGFMPLSELFVLLGNVTMSLVVRHRFGMGCFVFMLIARVLVLTDLALLPSDLRFVSGTI
jgi:hypothetical protein